MASGLLKMAAQMQEGGWGGQGGSAAAAAEGGRGGRASGVAAAEAAGRGREDSGVAAAAAAAGGAAVHVAQETHKGGRGREESGAEAAVAVPLPPVPSISDPRAGKKSSQGPQGKAGALREGPAAKDVSGMMSPALGVGGRPLGGPSLPMPTSTAEVCRDEVAQSLLSDGARGAATQHSPAWMATTARQPVGQSSPPVVVVVSDDARLVRHLRALRAAGFAVVLVSSNAATLAAAEAMGETTAEGRTRQRKPPSSGGVRERGGEAVAVRGEAGAAADIVLSWDAICAGEYRTTTGAQ